VMTHTKRTAKIIEKAVHERVRQEGYQCLVDKTGFAGHAEWFAVPREVAVGMIKEEFDKYLANLALTQEAGVVLPGPIAVTGTRTKEDKPVYTMANPGL